MTTTLGSLSELSTALKEELTEEAVVNLLRKCKEDKAYLSAIKLGEYFLPYFSHSFAIREILAFCHYATNQPLEAHKRYHKILDKFMGLPPQKVAELEHNARMCAQLIKDHYITYPPHIIQSILDRKKKDIPLFTFTITTCKRFDLFEKTMNSFLNCCKDVLLIDKWFCVDDNSSEEDRAKMKEKYPFFEFYLKTSEEKGHPQSMNIIRDHLTTPYFFHMEDDWQYFVEKNYITECLEILGSSNQLSQVLVNRNYGETLNDHQIRGGQMMRLVNGKRFYVHEFCPTNELMKKFHAKYGPHVKQCAYWPHYSFRPSLVRTKVLKEVGKFNEEVNHFEMDYSYRVTEKKYVSAFLEGIYSLHIGRLTSERHDASKLNAYILNDEAQFSGKEKKIAPPQKLTWKLKTFVVNLERRPDRWKSFDEKASTAAEFLKYQKYRAVDGSNLIPTPQLQQIFDGNDYNMRMGMVGCAMSHIQLYIDLVNSDMDVFCILEDDIEFTPDFRDKFVRMCQQLSNVDWDLAYLGHHAYNMSELIKNKKNTPSVYKTTAKTSLKVSMGGTGGYLITKKGAQKLLEFINRYGMTNGIDTVQQKSADTLNVYYCVPHLIFSECFRGNNRPDTDIQFNYTSLTLPIQDRLQLDIDYYTSLGQSLKEVTDLQTIGEDPVYYHIKDNEFTQVYTTLEKSDHPHYFLGKEYVVVVPTPTDEIKSGRFFDRLKCGDKFDVSQALVYKETEA